jgi:hypothetical protein
VLRPAVNKAPDIFLPPFSRRIQVNGSRPAATTGHEKGPECDTVSRAIRVGWLDAEAGIELAFTNPSVNVPGFSHRNPARI